MKPRPFSANEDVFLRLNYKTQKYSKLARLMDRSTVAIQDRLRILGLVKKATSKPAQLKRSVFFDLELVPLIDAGARKSGLSASAYVQEIVRERLKRKGKAA